MSLTEAEKRKIEEEEKYRVRVSSPIIHKDGQHTQKHGVPAILSLFIPGLGQMVKGQVGKGILILIVTVVGYMFMIIPGLIIHIWQIVDAYNS